MRLIAMFYRLSTYAIFAGLVAAGTPAAAQETVPLGIWTDAERSVVVRIAPCPTGASTFCGIVLEDNRPGPAANPPNHILIRSLRQDRQGWRGIINDGGTQLNFTMRLRSSNSAQARFCFGIVCDTETWSRIGAAGEAGTLPRR
jgi:uncharacterized protein (DUF2147 family)